MSEQQPNPAEFSSFADWCLHKDSLSKEARFTVEVLLKYAGTSDIDEANRILSSRNELHLSCNQISDLTPLQSLTNLTALFIVRNEILDLTPLQSLTNLKELLLSENEISDLTPLQSLTHLANLSLRSNKISDITPLQFLTNLTMLDLRNNRISDLTPLQSLTHLANLELKNNNISDITPLQSLTHLANLELKNNHILDLTPLQSLTNLTTLEMRNNKISDITPLQSLTNLTTLTLHNNQISDLIPLQFLTNLTKLNLDNNQISDITPLKSLTNLTWVNLNNNQISDITPLQSLTNLTWVNLKNNQISDITPLKSLTNLTHMYTNCTPEQEVQIAAYRHSWGTLANSTKPINRAQAAAAIKAIYETLGLEAPEITFCSSPDSASIQLQMNKMSNKIELKKQLDPLVINALNPFFFMTQRSQNFGGLIVWEEQLKQQKLGLSDLWNDSSSIVTPKYLVETLVVAEFCVSALGIVLKPEAQKVFEGVKQLLAECGWIFPLDDICIVCSRPTILSLDSEYRLHAEGEPALEFADGYKIYSYHGVTLPEKYGQIHPNLWQAQWLLEENNAELRRVLIQGIGYARICSELQATELDCWKEYTLLRIDIDADIDVADIEVDFFDTWDLLFTDALKKEDIYVLKMTCPSTGHIHALRVPPDMTSAKEAIRWVNWDIDSDEFSVQT